MKRNSEDLRARLAEAEEVLRAIRDGDVDAVMVSGDRGDQVYTLSGTDRIYRRLIETMNEGAATLSARGTILYCNLRLSEMLELPLDRILGTELGDYLAPADRGRLSSALELASKNPVRQELDLYSGSGVIVPVHLSASAFCIEGSETAYCIVLTDLTQKKHHERLIAEERIARSILDQAAETIVVCDERGSVIRCSQVTQRFCEGSPLGRPFADAFPLRSETSGDFHLAPVLSGSTLRNLDLFLETHGEKCDFVLNAAPLVCDQSILGCVVTMTDVSEQKKSAERLRCSELRYRSLTENSPDLIARFDRQCRHIYVNQAAARAGTLSADDYIGKTIREVGNSESVARVWEDRVRAVFDTGQANEVDDSFDTASGKRYFNTKFVPEAAADGSVLTVQSIARDMSSHKLAEERIIAQLKELERWQELMLDREDRVQALKREVNELCIQTGSVLRYPSQTAESIGPAHEGGAP
ncbi:MAG: PAS domain-containing protein [Spirochaetaceae bacterium]|nr:PAS domain-containing protein [Spirochaetaceae bacterium]